MTVILVALAMVIASCSPKGKRPPSAAPTATATVPANPALFPVKVKGKWGFINAAGKVVISPTFENAEDFREGLARVDAGFGGHSFIDQTGTVVVKGPFTCVPFYSDGMLEVVDPPGSDRWGYADRTGKMVLAPVYTSTLLSNFSEGLAAVTIRSRTKLPWEKEFKERKGYIDKTGRFVIDAPENYHVLWPFKEGLSTLRSGLRRPMHAWIH